MTFKKDEIYYGCLSFIILKMFILFLDKIVDYLGGRNFRIVYKVEGEKKEDFFIMKVMILGKTGNIDYTRNIKTMHSEFQIGIDLGSQCEYLVKAVSFFKEKESCFLIMEYCSGGNLEEQFIKQSKIPKSVYLIYYFYLFKIFILNIIFS
jgi:serine/threonine protein kinase